MAMDLWLVTFDNIFMSTWFSIEVLFQEFDHERDAEDAIRALDG